SGSLPNLHRRRLMAALRAKGWTLAAIGRHLGVTRQCVALTLQKAANPPRRSVPCTACRQEIVSSGVSPRWAAPALCPTCLDDSPAATFGQRLVSLRLQAGLTRSELARRAGVAIGAVHHYEQGLKYPGDDSRLKLARGLGVTVERLGVGSDRPERVGRGRPRKER